jgi:hypothetical protein
VEASVVESEAVSVVDREEAWEEDLVEDWEEAVAAVEVAEPLSPPSTNEYQSRFPNPIQLQLPGQYHFPCQHRIE